MNHTKRSVKQYSFKSPNLMKLRELASQVASPSDFQRRHGRLLDLLKVKIEEGILETLVQFYDPTYHCFTFADYQLVPTLEEYAYWIGLPISEREPFNGLEPTPKPAIIATTLHLKPSDIIPPHFIIKGGFLGLTTKFLYQKASAFAKAKKTDAFESILALLIYGLLLFPNMDNFVDINAIKIFLTKNPVPTLLADTYHSIHYRTSKGDGTIICCAPLLYKWFASHLPKSVFSKANTGESRWSQRIMPLTPTDIVWSHAAADTGVIINSCGEFQNVPLIGTCGGITYNPALAMRQFGYPMKKKPNNLSLSGEFYLNLQDPANKRMRFVQAWLTVRKLDGIQLGKKSSFVHESYTQWVIDRAMTYGLPYTLPRLLSSTTPTMHLPLPPKTMEEYQERLAESNRESATWKRKYEEAMLAMETMSGEIAHHKHELFKQSQTIVAQNIDIQAKDKLLRRHANKKEYMDFFASAHSDSDDSPT